MNDSREQFEAVAADWYGLDPEVIARSRLGAIYDNPKLAQAWRWWQFARSGVVVELPPYPEQHDIAGRWAEGVTDGLNWSADAIRAAGLGVKHG